MPQVDLTVYLRLPGQAANPVLYPAKVVQAHSTSSFTLQPEDDALACEVGLEILIYFEFGGEFVQQSACIEALSDDDSEGGISLKTIGERVSAENRQTYRVSTVMSELSVTFGGEENCPLRDVSVTGFAVIGSEKYKIGQILDTELTHDNKKYTGQVSIQSVREEPGGKTRYGVNCIKGDKSATALFKGIQCVSMSEQRNKLKRLHRSA